MLEKVVNDLVNKKLVFLVAMIMGGCFFSCLRAILCKPRMQKPRKNAAKKMTGQIGFYRVHCVQNRLKSAGGARHQFQTPTTG